MTATCSAWGSCTAIYLYPIALTTVLPSHAHRTDAGRTSSYVRSGERRYGQAECSSRVGGRAALLGVVEALGSDRSDGSRGRDFLDIRGSVHAGLGHVLHTNEGSKNATSRVR